MLNVQYIVLHYFMNLITEKMDTVMSFTWLFDNNTTKQLHILL